MTSWRELVMDRELVMTESMTSDQFDCRHPNRSWKWSWQQPADPAALSSPMTSYDQFLSQEEKKQEKKGEEERMRGK